ncbi:MAG: tRNA (adenosine(37)-N6)-threonylcarbamoyltransferase complex transferase subunit TsaD [Acidobacteriota bacterium]
MILGIETSCDDTACALIDGQGIIRASVVSSQLAHQPYGGVVPEIASREHLKNWPAVSAAAFAQAEVSPADLNAVAATRGPGLVGSLLVGQSLGRAMAFALDTPFYGVHHLEGHVVSPFLGGNVGDEPSPLPERFTALVVSGGHTSLLTVEGDRIESVAESRDDAIGEVFDKVGKRIGLAYPQGPRVDRLAETGVADSSAFTVPPLSDDELFFSYSGLKSQALRAIEKLERSGALAPDRADPEGDDPEGEALPQAARDLLASFRHATVAQVIHRLNRSAQRIECLAVSGGVAANKLLRRRLIDWADEKSVDLRLVPLRWSGDNAAMIAFAAWLRRQRGEPSSPPEDLTVASRIPFPSRSAL